MNTPQTVAAQPVAAVPAARTRSGAHAARLAVLLASLLYGYVLRFAHQEYLHPVWDYFGFTYRHPTLAETMLAFTLVAIGALSVPARLSRPSSVVILLLFVVVYVPTMMISLALDTDRLGRYLPSLLALAVVFCSASLASRAGVAGQPPPEYLPGRGFTQLVVVAWAACCAVLIAEFGSIMSLVSLADVYGQRALAADTSLLLGYVQTYFANVLSPALLAIGLIRRDLRLVVLGIGGCVIIYMISAQRTVALLPVAMILLHLALASRHRVLRTFALPIAGLSMVLLWIVFAQADNVIATVLALFVLFRTIGLPGLTFSQYYDLFSVDGFTWWSHVKGLSLVIPPPPSFATDPLWPALGRLIGDRLYSDPENNANANLFSGDGVAAAGALGVLVIGIVYAIWLMVLDRAARGWDRRFVMLVTMPVALSLTNGHLSTVLLSYGGIFWVVVLACHKPRGPRPRADRRGPSS